MKAPRQEEEEKGQSKLANSCYPGDCRHQGDCFLHVRVRGGLFCCMQGLLVKYMLLPVTFSRSGAGTLPLYGSNSAVRQWQVGCGTPQPSPLERSAPATRKPRLDALACA